jgi:hypothetical protein
MSRKWNIFATVAIGFKKEEGLVEACRAGTVRATK